jgi:glutathione S-transferase
MLELYHSVNSVCAQKVRIALAAKGLQAKEHVISGDALFTPEYLKLNPNAVVPTLVDDGVPVIESSVILYYLDEKYPEPKLMPADPHLRARVRLFNKLIDEYVHNYCTVISFATVFRPNLADKSEAEREAYFAKAPSKKRSEYKRDVVKLGMDSKYVVESIEFHEKLLDWIEESMQRWQYLAGDSLSLADIAAIPYVIRLDLIGLSRMWDKRPGVAAWYGRMHKQDCVEKAVFQRMEEADWKPFRTLGFDPWPQVSRIIAAL